jgi:erythromycin esterase-like protein
MPEPELRRHERDVGRADEGRALVRAAAEGLPEFEDAAFGALFDRFGECRVVLVGEASHGTSEFYRARERITRHLVERHGFGIVAIEGDWPDVARLDAYVRDRAQMPPPEEAFVRFPTWMWRNEEVLAFLEWLRAYNRVMDPDQRVEIRGLDIYSLGASVDAVLRYLDRVDPAIAAAARERYGCLMPWRLDPADYGQAALAAGHAPCEEPVTAMLTELLEKWLHLASRDSGEFFDAAQNARLIKSAEKYYRIMYYGGAESWNLRDRHMFETLLRVLAARGANAKAVVWAHNSHIGNAAATEMGEAGEFNIGQLCHEHFGADAARIGFGTDHGTVAAARNWDQPMQVMQVQPSLTGSYERLFHRSGVDRGLFELSPERHGELCALLGERRLERAIGVVYRPETERWSHYFLADLPRQFDAWIWLEETSAVMPLPAARPHGVPDTFPFGV